MCHAREVAVSVTARGQRAAHSLAERHHVPFGHAVTAHDEANERIAQQIGEQHVTIGSLAHEDLLGSGILANMGPIVLRDVGQMVTACFSVPGQQPVVDRRGGTDRQRASYSSFVNCPFLICPVRAF
jgi:hypothetical protein